MNAQLQTAWGINPSGKTRFRDLHAVRSKKTRLVRYSWYLWVHIEGKGFISNKVSNLAGHTVRYSPLN